MFDRTAFEQFDDATPGSPGSTNPLPPLRRRKTLARKLRFWTLNVILGVPAFLIVLAIAAEGARSLVDIAQMKLHRLPVPAVSVMANYQGFALLDLAHLISGVLCIAVSITWFRVIQEIKGYGTIASLPNAARLVTWLYAIIAVVLIFADAFLFYMGIAARGGGWGEMPAYIPFVCTLLYLASTAAGAAFHSDYVNSGRV